MRTGLPVSDDTVSLPTVLDVAALVLQHADLHRILLAGFTIAGDLVVAGHHQPQRVADRRHAHAEVGGARPIDRDLHFRAGVAVVGLGVDQARRLPCAFSRICCE